jgi:DNA polymerase
MLQIVTPQLLAAGPAPATTPHVLHRDFETRSRAVLKQVGAHRYAGDPSTQILCCCYAVDDGPVQRWLPGDPVPDAFLVAAQNEKWIVAAHNDAFETVIEKQILAPQYGWPARTRAAVSNWPKITG